MLKELLIGCGHMQNKRIGMPGTPSGWSELTTLDINPDVQPNIEWDLERLPLPFDDDSFDEIHAYHVLEHVGRQGDYRFFFAQFEDFWRILKPGAYFCGIVPEMNTPWVFGDPGHTRVIAPEMFVFLDQGEYTRQVGQTMMTDYRHVYRADFNCYWFTIENGDFRFALKAIKPSRIVV